MLTLDAKTRWGHWGEIDNIQANVVLHTIYETIKTIISKIFQQTEECKTVACTTIVKDHTGCYSTTPAATADYIERRNTKIR
jgi:hypothetical protein